MCPAVWRKEMKRDIDLLLHIPIERPYPIVSGSYSVKVFPVHTDGFAFYSIIDILRSVSDDFRLTLVESCQDSDSLYEIIMHIQFHGFHLPILPQW